MKIYINADDFRDIAIKTKERLIEISEKLDIEIVDNPHDSDFTCSIGGDGTFLKSSAKSPSPVVGINCGTLGYLTDTNPEDIEKALNNLLEGNFYIENRMMLEGEIIKDDEIIPIPASLNEIAVSKNLFGILKFDVNVNGKLINSYNADGVIVCTPTGSTAYNLSCGGPIVDPTAEIITLTPIAPHTIINRSIVLSDESIVDIRMGELRENTESYVMYDGHSVKIHEGDTLRVKKSRKVTQIVKFREKSFIDNIREKIN